MARGSDADAAASHASVRAPAAVAMGRASSSVVPKPVTYTLATTGPTRMRTFWMSMVTPWSDIEPA